MAYFTVYIFDSIKLRTQLALFFFAKLIGVLIFHLVVFLALVSYLLFISYGRSLSVKTMRLPQQFRSQYIISGTDRYKEFRGLPGYSANTIEKRIDVFSRTQGGSRGKRHAQ